MNIDFIRSICTKLPAATEDVKWDHDLVFSVGGKMFCAASLELPFTCSFKVPDDQFEEISNRQGFIPAPYLARARWVQVTDPAAMHRDEWEYFLRQSYDLVKMKLTGRQRAALGL